MQQPGQPGQPGQAQQANRNAVSEMNQTLQKEIKLIKTRAFARIYV